MRPSVVVITGAASGIGYALARVCVLRHWHVVMIDNVEPLLNEAVSQLSLLSPLSIAPFVCDVTDRDALLGVVALIYERFKHVDVLINNAGISGPLVPLWDAPIAEVQNVMAVNVYGVLHGIQAFLPHFFRQEARAHIVNMASVYGLCSSSLAGTYAMSKHAIVALSESLYFDLQRLNKPVDVSVVCPSFVNTPLLTNATPTPNNSLHARLQQLVEYSRSPEEMAEAIFQSIDQKQFYILPDQDVQHYTEQRHSGILEKTAPVEHGLEKIMKWLSRITPSKRS